MPPSKRTVELGDAPRSATLLPAEDVNDVPDVQRTVTVADAPYEMLSPVVCTVALDKLTTLVPLTEPATVSPAPAELMLDDTSEMPKFETRPLSAMLSEAVEEMFVAPVTLTFTFTASPRKRTLFAAAVTVAPVKDTVLLPLVCEL